MNAMRSIFRLRASKQRAIDGADSGRSNILTRAPISRLDGSKVRITLSWLIGFALISGAVAWNTEAVAAKSYQIFVPMITTDVVPTGSGAEPTRCDLNEQEAAIAQLMEADPGQNRKDPVCNPILAEVARGRARDMALRDYFSHVNPDGDGPNLLVREAGFLLPDWYTKDQDANNIESIGAGYDTPQAAWQAWLNSSAHRRHVLGTDPFYASQNSYGVGFYTSPGSTYKFYWVFISAPTPDQ